MLISSEAYNTIIKYELSTKEASLQNWAKL